MIEGAKIEREQPEITLGGWRRGRATDKPRTASDWPKLIFWFSYAAVILSIAVGVCPNNAVYGAGAPLAERAPAPGD
jgi:hypothetical protein